MPPAKKPRRKPVKQDSRVQVTHAADEFGPLSPDGPITVTGTVLQVTEAGYLLDVDGAGQVFVAKSADVSVL